MKGAQCKSNTKGELYAVNAHVRGFVARRRGILDADLGGNPQAG
jgi:hypothetical protein